MDRYTTTENLTLEKIKEVMKKLEPKPINIEALNKFIEQGGDMKNLCMATSEVELKDIKEIPTQHGVLQVQYSPYIPKGTVYFMHLPNLEDWLKPNWEIESRSRYATNEAVYDDRNQA